MNTNNSRALQYLTSWLKDCETSARINELDQLPGPDAPKHPNNYAPEEIVGMEYPLIRHHVEAIERDMTAAMENIDHRKTASRLIDIDPTPHRKAIENLAGPDDNELEQIENEPQTLEKLEILERQARIERIREHVATIPMTTHPSTGKIDLAHGIDWTTLNS